MVKVLVLSRKGVTNSQEVVFVLPESKVTSRLMKVGEQSSLGTSGGSRRPG